jgi:hypothetical protein
MDVLSVMSFARGERAPVTIPRRGQPAGPACQPWQGPPSGGHLRGHATDTRHNATPRPRPKSPSHKSRAYRTRLGLLGLLYIDKDGRKTTGTYLRLSTSSLLSFGPRRWTTQIQQATDRWGVCVHATVIKWSLIRRGRRLSFRGLEKLCCLEKPNALNNYRWAAPRSMHRYTCEAIVESQDLQDYMWGELLYIRRFYVWHSADDVPG